jgi:hypothetical protein
LRNQGLKILNKPLYITALSACFVIILSAANPQTSEASDAQPMPDSPAPAPGVGPRAPDLGVTTGTQSNGPAPTAPKRGSPAAASGSECPQVAPGKKTGNCRWYDPANPDADHMQDITYERANDSLIELNAYLEQKLRYLEIHPSEVIEVLGDTYCTDTDDAGCLERYKRYVLKELNQIKASSVMNNTSTNSLRSKRTDARTLQTVGGDVPVLRRDPIPGKPQPSARPLVSHFSTFSDLKELHRLQSDKIRDSITNGAAETMKEYSQVPTCADFPLFKEIPRNPDSPNDGSFIVAVLKQDGSGKPECDEKSLKRALKVYAKAHDEGRGLDEDAKAIGKGLKDKAEKKQIQSLVPKILDDKSSKDQKIFKATRDALADAYNATDVKKRKPSSNKKDANTIQIKMSDADLDKATGERPIKAQANTNSRIGFDAKAVQEDLLDRMDEIEGIMPPSD